MNLILLEETDYCAENLVELTGRRLRHVLEVHRAAPGDVLRVGQLNGLIGSGRVVELSADRLVLEVVLDLQPPHPLDVILLLALPRPKMLKRILQAVTSLGVKRIVLLNSFRVEKSFWNSPLLQPEGLREQLLLGLEQACDTRLPEVRLRPLFKPFVEDELPGLLRGRRGLVAHPAATATCPVGDPTPAVLAIGPEGGFIPYEIDKFRECGCEPVSFGPRILRVETAVPVLLARLS